MRKFLDKYKCPQDYLDAKVLAIEPMTAKEPLNDKELEMMLNSKDYIAEEKKDGTRGILHFREDGVRLFSRRVSKKTGWYAENSDSVPHIRDMEFPEELRGTILDGELSLDNGVFNDISGLMNCLPEEAIKRQEEIGWVKFNAFDIIYYKGVYIAKMPLEKRKVYLKKVVKALASDNIREEYYTDDLKIVTFTPELYQLYKKQGGEKTYPGLANCIGAFLAESKGKVRLNKRAWYDYIVMTGGEGLMLKPKNGTYKHRRGREYTKYKKFITRECVILGFGEPTEEYTGKDRKNWIYWGMYRQGHLVDTIEGEEPSPWDRDHTVEPITKFFYHNWIGTVIYGVVITPEELEALKKANPKEKYITQTVNGTLYLNVGESSGFDDEMRAYMTDNKEALIGRVIELKAHEVLKKTGKLRHPRFLRFRDDKNPEDCIWVDHIGG